MNPPDTTKLVEGVASSKHPLYSTWCSMKSRCNNPNHKHFKYYGGRGIKVCERWSESFAAFVEDMGARPPGYTVERVDSEEGYVPENCVWASRAEQMCNTRDRRDNKLGERNIHFVPERNRYHVQIRINGQKLSKRFKTLEEAIEYRDFMLGT